ncbi:MAG: hypothetical protein U9N12_00700 [Euryarchaeota archaeon]|nr:hypothetical protein [Euryarchaeota archaeon]
MWVRIILVAIVLVVTCAPAAGDRCEEDVWICQGVYEINLSERVSIDDYTIKLRDISNNSAMLVLYKNKQFIDRYYMAEGDTETYFDRFRITLSRLENESATVTPYMYGKERLWAKGDAVNLLVGENYNTGDYQIHVTGFTDDSVNLSIDKGGIPLASDMFDVGDSRIYEGVLKVCVRYLQGDYCILETYHPLTPALDIDIGVNDRYQPDQMIECGITIRNGGVPVRDVLLDVQVSNKPDTGSDVVFNETLQESFSIWYQAIHSSDICNLTIYPPVLPYPSNISIVASARGYTWNGDSYSTNYTRETRITPYILARKLVTPEELTVPESAMVTITVRNLRDNGTDIELTDTVPGGFVIENGNGTENDVGIDPAIGWGFRLEPHSFMNVTYQMAARKVGTFEVPACMAAYEGYAVSSHPGSTVTVHGPVITAEKVLLATLDEHTRQVVIRIENGGDRAADIEFVDEVPPGIAVIGGDMAGKARILPEEARNYSYVIQFEDLDSLPPVVVRFTDDCGTNGTVRSNSVGGTADVDEVSGAVGTEGAEGGGVRGEGADRTVPGDVPTATISRGELAMLLIHIFILFACIFLVPVVAGYLMLRNTE